MLSNGKFKKNFYFLHALENWDRLDSKTVKEQLNAANIQKIPVKTKTYAIT